MSTSAATSSYVFSYSVVTKTTTYTASISQRVRCDTSGGAFTVTLPDATAYTGRRISVQKISSDGNLLTVNTTSSQTINGDLTQAWSAQWDNMEVESNGSNWEVV